MPTCPAKQLWLDLYGYSTSTPALVLLIVAVRGRSSRDSDTATTHEQCAHCDLRRPGIVAPAPVPTRGSQQAVLRVLLMLIAFKLSTPLLFLLFEKHLSLLHVYVI